VSIYETAIGRAILANLTEEKFAEIWQELLADPKARKHFGQNSDRFLTLLEAVRRNGYSVSDEDFIPGIRAIAAPIFSATGTVEAAINMPVFTKTVSQKELNTQFAPMLVDTAKKISACVAS
jgi:IclR family pca regulon transcriptional regulator